jgi:hypothetical protein
VLATPPKLHDNIVDYTSFFSIFMKNALVRIVPMPKLTQNISVVGFGIWISFGFWEILDLCSFGYRFSDSFEFWLRDLGFDVSQPCDIMLS